MRSLFVAAAAACLLCVAGCETDPPPAPRAEGAIVVQFTADELSEWSSVPMGTYHVPNSQVLVSGFEKGSALALAIGSVGGPAAMSGAMSQATDGSGAREAVAANEGALQITLPPLAEQSLQSLINSDRLGPNLTLAASPAAPTLRIGGNVVLEFFENGNVLPFVVLQATLRSAKGSSVWTGRYAASVGEPHPLSGEDSWTARSGKLLKSVVAAELERALLVLLMDVSSPLPRDPNAQIAAEGCFPFIRKRIQVLGMQIAENGDWFAFQPRVPSTSLLSGVHVMDRLEASYRRASPRDPLMKAVGPGEPKP